jgi:hypothetical protein
MLKASSRWKIYTRHGGLTFYINKDIILNHPNLLHSKNLWFSETSHNKEKLINAWQVVNRLHSDIRIIQIIQVEDYYCLISDGFYNSHDYRMFPEE